MNIEDEIKNNERYCKDLISWLEEMGFKNDRGWDHADEQGLHFYSFVKGNYRFEIRMNWHKKYSTFDLIHINFLNCANEHRGEPFGAAMWMGQRQLLLFTESISRSLFINLCVHYKI